MKRNSDGSILIWSIFLVIFVSFSFLYISNQISIGIDKNKQKISWAQISSILDNFNFDSKILNLNNNENLEVKFFWNFSSMLWLNKSLEFSFSVPNIWSITIDNWWPVFYKVYTWSVIYSSWLVIDNQYDIPIQANSKLLLENLWWLAKVDLDFDSNTWVTYPYNYLNIKKSIWWIDITKEIVEKK